MRASRTRRSIGTWLADLIPAGKVPAVGLLAVYCVLLLGVPANLIVPQIGAPGTPANLWGMGLLLWWVAGRIGGGNALREKSAVRIALGVFAVAVLVSYIAAMTRGWYAPPNVRQATDEVYDLVPATIQQVRGAMISAADRGLLSMAGWIGVALVALDGLRSWKDIDRLLIWLTWMAGIVAAVGILQYFTGLDISPYYKIPGLAPNADFGFVDGRSVIRRILATATHPIEFGVVMAAVFPLALHRSIFNARSRRVWIPTAAIGFATALSVSRSAVLVLGIALTILLLGWPARWRRRLYLGLPVAVVAIRVLSPGVVGTIMSLFTSFGEDTSVTGRTEDYGVVFKVFGENPLFGRGLFTFVPRYYRILDNQILMFLLELGIVGTVAFLGLAFTAYFNARGARRRSLDFEHQHLGLALSASIAGVIISYATFDALGFPMAAGLTFLLFGLAGAAWQVAVREQETIETTAHHPDRVPELAGANQ